MSIKIKTKPLTESQRRAIRRFVRHALRNGLLRVFAREVLRKAGDNRRARELADTGAMR